MADEKFTLAGRPKYEVIRPLGEGHFGEVVLAETVDDKTEVAIKIITVKGPLKQVADREIDSLSQLRHPNIIGYIEHWWTADKKRLWLVTEYCNGGDLSRKIESQKQSGGYFEEKVVAEFTLQIAKALEYMHGKGVLHRDLKPSNILLHNDVIKLGDFGLARELTSGYANTFCGTVQYISPEILQKKPYKQKADVWSFGCCVYELITLELAFIFLSKMYGPHSEEILNRDDLPRQYSQELREFVASIFIREPNNRPSMRDLLEHPYFKNRTDETDKLISVDISRIQLNLEENSFSNTVEPILAELNKLGYKITSDHKIVKKSDDKPFEIKISDDGTKNEENYQKVAKCAMDYVDAWLTCKLHMKKLRIPLNATEDAVTSFVYVTPDYETRQKMALLVQGGGKVTAGHWSRMVMVTDNIYVGSQIPYIERLRQLKYSVIVLNPNYNSTKDGTKILSNSTPVEHATNVWDNIVMKVSSLERVAVIAHSEGGRTVTEMAGNRLEQFQEKVFAVAMIDSIHNIGEAQKELGQLYSECGKNWASSDQALGSSITTKTIVPDMPIVSSGDKRHRWTTCSSLDHVIQFLKDRLRTVEV